MRFDKLPPRCDVVPMEEAVHGVGGFRDPQLKELEDENRRLKQLVVSLTLDKKMLQDVLSKKLQGPPYAEIWCGR